jgi:hypothetical protein
MHEATNALHRLMRIALYRPGGTAIQIVVDLPAFLYSSILFLPTTKATRPRYGQYEVKPTHHIVY